MTVLCLQENVWRTRNLSLVLDGEAIGHVTNITAQQITSIFYFITKFRFLFFFSQFFPGTLFGSQFFSLVYFFREDILYYK